MDSLLKKKSSIHLERKLFHTVACLTLVLICSYLSETNRFFFLASVSAFGLALERIRLRKKNINSALFNFFGRFFRQDEERDVSGPTFMAVGALFSYALFNEKIATLALLFLAIADPLASLIGTKWGKRKIIWNKSWLGFFTCWISCVLITYFYCLSFNYAPSPILLISLGLTAAIAESFSPINDNLSLPLLTCFSLWLYSVL